MKKEEVLRLVESIHKDKSISRRVLFAGLQYAMIQAACKVYGVEEEDTNVLINELSGDIKVTVKGKPVDMSSGELGRIAAQTTKQYLKAKIVEAEKDIIVEEFSDKIRTLVSVEVLRKERGNIVVQVLGHGFEAIIPREEQVPTERYRTGDRLRCYIVSMNIRSNRANLVLSRTRPELVHELFIADVPEIADDLIVVMELAREAGYRTKIAVHCDDDRIDCVGACVGPRGTRIRNIINELGGEKIDIIRWDPTPETFIANSLAPARISRVYIDKEAREAIVVVPDDQLSLAIGKKGQNVRLTCRLTRWKVDVKSEVEFETERTDEDGEIAEGLTEVVINQDGDQEQSKAEQPVAIEKKEETTDSVEISQTATEEDQTDSSPSEEQPTEQS